MLVDCGEVLVPTHSFVLIIPVLFVCNCFEKSQHIYCIRSVVNNLRVLMSAICVLRQTVDSIHPSILYQYPILRELALIPAAFGREADYTLE